MRTFKQEELGEILRKHQLYLIEEAGGECADLSGSDLRGSNLSRSKGQFYITQRSDGYQFYLVQQEDDSWLVHAGCRYMTIAAYRAHVTKYDDEQKRIETNLILDFAEAKLRALA